MGLELKVTNGVWEVKSWDTAYRFLGFGSIYGIRWWNKMSRIAVWSTQRNTEWTTAGTETFLTWPSVDFLFSPDTFNAAGLWTYGLNITNVLHIWVQPEADLYVYESAMGYNEPMKNSLCKYFDESKMLPIMLVHSWTNACISPKWPFSSSNCHVKDFWLIDPCYCQPSWWCQRKGHWGSS